MDVPFDDDVASALGLGKEPAGTKRKAEDDGSKRSGKRPGKKVTLEKEPPPPPPNTPTQDEGDNNERTTLYAQLCSFVDTFPDDARACGLSRADANADTDTLKLQIAKINQRIGARQELQVMHMLLISGAAGLEQAATMIPGQPVHLQGLSTNVAGSMHLFDESLKQIQCKYAGALSFGPEATLMFTLARICTTTHLTNKAKEVSLSSFAPVAGESARGAAVASAGGVLSDLAAGPEAS